MNTTPTNPARPDTDKPDSECKQHLRYRFTPEEVTELAIEQAEKLREVTSLEGEKKRIASQYKSRIDNLESEIEQLSESITTGYEMRMVDCDVYYHTPGVGVKSYFRRDTGAFVRTEDMTESEKQRNFDFEEEEDEAETLALPAPVDEEDTVDVDFEEEKKPTEFYYYAWVTAQGSDAKARNMDGDVKVSCTAGEILAVANLVQKEYGNKLEVLNKAEPVAEDGTVEVWKTFRTGGPQWRLWKLRVRSARTEELNEDSSDE